MSDRHSIDNVAEIVAHMRGLKVAKRHLVKCGRVRYRRQIAWYDRRLAEQSRLLERIVRRRAR